LIENECKKCCESTKDSAKEQTKEVDEVALRATFFIDSNGIIRYQATNDLPIGRNIDEILRIIDAWKYHEKHGEVCPANWKQGDQGMKETSEGVKDYAASNFMSEQ